MPSKLIHLEMSDEVLNRFAKGSGSKQINEKEFFDNTERFKGCTLITRGLKHHRLMTFARESGLNFVYIETGYFGNLNNYYLNRSKNKGEGLKGKLFHRVVINDLQLGEVIQRPNDRRALINENIKARYSLEIKDIIKPWKYSGNTILICPPSDKTGKVLGIDTEKWVNKVTKKIQKRTDKKIRIRYKPKSRTVRLYDSLIQNDFDNDIFALVTHNSIAGTEAVFHGIPVFTLGGNAAEPMGLQDLNFINEPIRPDREAWINHLCYGQFTSKELYSGLAWRILNAK